MELRSKQRGFNARVPTVEEEEMGDIICLDLSFGLDVMIVVKARMIPFLSSP